MTKGSKYSDHKKLMLISGAVHTDLYDRTDIIPFEKLERFFGFLHFHFPGGTELEIKAKE